MKAISVIVLLFMSHQAQADYRFALGANYGPNPSSDPNASGFYGVGLQAGWGILSKLDVMLDLTYQVQMSLGSNDVADSFTKKHVRLNYFFTQKKLSAYAAFGLGLTGISYKDAMSSDQSAERFSVQPAVGFNYEGFFAEFSFLDGGKYADTMKGLQVVTLAIGWYLGREYEGSTGSLEEQKRKLEKMDRMEKLKDGYQKVEI